MRVTNLSTEIHVSAREAVKLMFGDGRYSDPILDRWGCGIASPSMHEPGRATGYARAKEMLSLLDGALEALGSKKGERADAARSFLKTHRDEIMSSMNAYAEATRVHDPHPIPNSDRIEKLTQQFGIADAEYQAAKRAYEGGINVDEVDKLRDRNDRCRAKLNAVIHEIKTLAEACRFPNLPDPKVFVIAKNQTDEIVDRGMRASKPATQIELALRQGGDAARNVVESGTKAISVRGTDIVRLWICWEPEGDPVCAQRLARFLEGGASLPEVLPPEPEKEELSRLAPGPVGSSMAAMAATKETPEDDEDLPPRFGRGHGVFEAATET